MFRALIVLASVLIALVATGCKAPLEVKEVDQGKADRIIQETES